MEAEIWVAIIGASVGAGGVLAGWLGARQQRKEERTSISNDLLILEKIDPSWPVYKKFQKSIEDNISRHLDEEKRAQKYSSFKGFILPISLLYLPFYLGILLGSFTRNLWEEYGVLRVAGEDDQFREALIGFLFSISWSLIGGSLIAVVVLCVRHVVLATSRAKTSTQDTN